jgi:hypothetical protein
MALGDVLYVVTCLERERMWMYDVGILKNKFNIKNTQTRSIIMETFVEYIKKSYWLLNQSPWPQREPSNERFVTVIFKNRKLVFVSSPLRQSEAETMAIRNGVARGGAFTSKIVSVEEGEKLRQQLPEPLDPTFTVRLSMD